LKKKDRGLKIDNIRKEKTIKRGNKMNQSKTFTIHSFKPIGKAVLHRMIGLRENYALDEPKLPENCCDCPFFQEMQIYDPFPESPEYINADKNCKKCTDYQTYHLWSVKTSPDYTEYVNEKNRYGAGKSLKFNAIMLFITYHMICTEQNGVLKNISIRELADTLGCSKKTIRYNNRVLCDNNYIYLSKGELSGTVNICLKEYPTYFQPAQKGGRGFYTISDKLFESLKELKLTNQLRIILKTLLDNDSAITPLPNEITESYKNMRLYLPKYCKRNIIQKTLDSINSTICTIKTSLHDVYFKMNPAFDGKTTRQNLLQKNLGIIEQNIITVSNSIKDALDLKQIPVFKDTFFSLLQKNFKHITYRPLSINKKQLNDLAEISIDYSADMVLTAVATIYYTIICNNQTIRNFGGLIRDTIKSNIDKLSSFSSSLS
jgi:hypothetical protein